jgi:hypothetical protein
MNNECIYAAPHSTLLRYFVTKQDLLIGADKLQINSGCKGFSTSALLQASFAVMSNVSLKADLLKQIPLQYDCCVELNRKFNLSHLSVGVKFKQTVSHFDDLQ